MAKRKAKALEIQIGKKQTCVKAYSNETGKEFIFFIHK